MTNFSPGRDISLGTKYEIAHEMAPRTRITKVGALLLSQFGLSTALNFQLFGMITAFKVMELKRNISLAAYLSARKSICKKRKYIFKLAEFIASLTASRCLTWSALRLMLYIFHLSFEIRETMIKFFLLSPLFH